MKTRLHRLFPLLLLTGCVASNPLQIPDEEWAQMDTEQRLRAHEAQARLDQQQAELRAHELRQREAKQARQAALEREQKAERARLRRIRYENAYYGEIVQCVLEPGQARHSKGWRKTDPMAFEVLRGERNWAQLFDYKGREMYEVEISLSRRSNRLELCINSGRQCDGFRASENQFRRGVQRPVHLGEKMKGELRCNLKYLPQRY